MRTALALVLLCTLAAAKSDPVEESFDSFQKTVKQLKTDIEKAASTGEKKTKTELERTKASLEKIKDMIQRLGNNVTDEIDATVKRLNKMAEDIE